MSKPITSRIQHSTSKGMSVSPNKQTEPIVENVVDDAGKLLIRTTTPGQEGSAGDPGDPGSSGKIVKAAENQMSDDKWKEYLANESEEQKRKRYAREQAEGLIEGYKPPKPATPGTAGTPDKKEDVPQLINTRGVGKDKWDRKWEQQSSEKMAGKVSRQSKKKANLEFKKSQLLETYDKDGDGKLSFDEKKGMKKGFLGFGSDRKKYEKVTAGINKAGMKSESAQQQYDENVKQISQGIGVGQKYVSGTREGTSADILRGEAAAGSTFNKKRAPYKMGGYGSKLKK